MIDMTQGFTIVRDFDATPQDLWQAWTDPDEAAAWWHPRGVHTPRETVSIDARVGGRYAYTMVDDETGERYPTGGVYREVEEPQRLAFTWGRPEADPDDAPLITVTFEAAGSGTRMTFDLRGVDPALEEAGVHEGWGSALDELAAHLGQRAAR
ncbi:SRPBCC family protein [Cellulomonas chengniuliangii]|uniref:SRPBCC domain-containing protein n=1 Tax=Cellulomonas chengniuliangii TaxID=2968084 RepID=A0ABY5L172_9CELL|nr:SRPBCC domain-containing protein [Cellulomonas chengniuliangii]MCC2307552.1 SRPBCC domain-containing protein [Cellulomonas chengniuliangii]MCC2318664.1 SRPBCC domain-containing protein [Cellulomonas chengniuliangii]UUI75678.1 SRPBCC domain-containing protein [Cellulomonas chengniuliangii]